MAATTESVLGVFAHVDATVHALEELKAKGYHDFTVYMPVPVHQIEDVLERDRPVSKVRLFTLIGGLTGLFLATLGTDGKVLLVDRHGNENLALAARNNPEIKTVDALGVHVYDVVDRSWLVVSEQALGRLVEVLES